MAQRRTTLRDVAVRAGLSSAAISQILNERGNFPEATRQRVIALAAEMGYRPNPMGRSLASGRTHLLAVYFSQPRHVDHFLERDYVRQVYITAAQEAIDHGYTLILGPPSPEHSIWNRIPVEGVLVVSPRRQDPVADLLCRLNVPVVVLGRDTAGREVQGEVDYDVQAATTELLGHLEHQGARSIAYVGVGLDDSFADDVERAYAGWARTTGQRAIVIRESGEAARRQAIEELLSSAPPDAIFGDTWEVAQLVAQVARSNGISVPAQLMVAAFGDSEPGPDEIALTKVRLLPERAAIEALQLLVELVEDKSQQPKVVLRHELQRGPSTAGFTPR